MVGFRLARRARRLRINAWFAAGLLVAFGAYVIALTQMQHTTERTYAALRVSDPDLYLAKIRQAEGFRTYLRQFAALKGQTPQAEAPPFLIGRWALYDQPMRVDDAYVPPICLDDVVIQDGSLRTGRPHRASYPVRYRDRRHQGGGRARQCAADHHRAGRLRRARQPHRDQAAGLRQEALRLRVQIGKRTESAFPQMTSGGGSRGSHRPNQSWTEDLDDPPRFAAAYFRAESDVSNLSVARKVVPHRSRVPIPPH